MSKRDSWIFLGGMTVVTAIAIRTASFLQSYGSVVQAWITVMLVILTAAYVRQTGRQAEASRQQAEASVKMAEETREHRVAMYKPHIVLETVRSYPGEYFVKELVARCRNEQGGTAINVRLNVDHPPFKFSATSLPFSVSVGQSSGEYSLYAIDPSVEKNPSVPIEPIAILFANYEDVSGNAWHSTLELHWGTHWGAKTKDITPGRMQVAISGHFKGGVNQND